MDQQGGRTRYIGGSGNIPSPELISNETVSLSREIQLQLRLCDLVLTGETLLEVHQRLLKEREMKIRSALEKLRRKRHLLRSQRKHKEFPVVSVLGYTNCGE